MSNINAFFSLAAFDSNLWVRLTLALLHFLWLGCVVALAAALAARLLRRASAQARYLVNVAGLLAMAACLPATYVLAPAPRPESLRATASAEIETRDVAIPRRSADPTLFPPPGEPRAAPAREVVELAEARDVATTPAVLATPADSAPRPSLLQLSAPFVAVVYFLGVALMLGRLTVALCGGRRLRLSARPVEDAGLLATAARQARRIGLAIVPAIGWCERIAAPVVVGIVRPMILLPTSLATGLDEGQLAALLAHELSHIRRFDLLVNLLQRLIEATLFFHPAVWYLSRQVSIERENACDDLVLSAGWPRVQYADALVRMAELCAGSRGEKFAGGPALLAASGESPSQFKRRVLRLLGQEPAPELVLNRAGVVALVVTISCLLISPLVVRIFAGGERPDELSDSKDDFTAAPPQDGWPQFGGSSLRNHATAADLPESFDLATKKNVRWTAQLGSVTFGSPVTAGGKVLVGTNNESGRIARYPKKVDLACLQCFDLASGEFLWQYSSEKLPTGRMHDWPQIGLCSTPCISGDRVWLVTNRCEVVCLDLEGFRDRENDGPVKDEPAGENEADVVWRFDLMEGLGVRPFQQSASSVTLAEGLVLLNTSNGVNESYTEVVAPRAPSFVALHRDTGRLVWSDSTPGGNILPTCPASSPAVAELGGVWQAVFAGGDGWLYGFDLGAIREGKSKLLWKFDCNPKTSRWQLGSRGDRNSLIAMPVVFEGRIYISVGRSPEEGEGSGRLWCIDPTKRGDISPELVFNKSDPTKPIPPKRLQACDPAAGDFTRANSNSGAVWHYESFDENGDGKHDFAESMHRAIGSVALTDGLAFVSDVAGILHCLDARTGRVHWSHDLMANAWSTPLVAGGRVYVADEDGDVAVFKLANKKQLLAEFNVEQPIYSSFAVAGETLILASKTRLIAVSNPPAKRAPPDKGARGARTRPKPVDKAIDFPPRPDDVKPEEDIDVPKQDEPANEQPVRGAAAEATKNVIAWGETVNGLQFGLNFPGGTNRFRVGQTMAFAIHARNKSDKAIDLRYGWPSSRFAERVGDQVSVSPMFVGGQMFTHRVTLKPGDERELPELEQRPTQEVLLAPRDWKGVGEPFVTLEPMTKAALISSAVLLVEPEKDSDWRGKAATGALPFEVVDAGGRFRQVDEAAWGEPIAWPAKSWKAPAIPEKMSKDELWNRLTKHLLSRVKKELSPHSFGGSDGQISIGHRTREHHVWRPSGKGGSPPVRRTETGPRADGLMLEIWLADEEGQGARPQTLDSDPWRVYAGEVHLPELKTSLVVNVSYGPRTDRKLLHRFVSPHDWLAALVGDEPK